MPKKLWTVGILILIIPMVLYNLLDDSKWIGTAVGLIAFSFIFPLLLFLYIANYNNHMITRGSWLRTLKNKKLTKGFDISVRVILGFLALWILTQDGIPLLKDFHYLIGRNDFIVEATVVNRTSTIAGGLTATQFITVRDSKAAENKNLSSSFIYEKYIMGEEYTFYLLPNSNKILRAKLAD